ncbi:MAG: hypothetical protein JO279_07640 [Verrucomicrobia bacterium]|nr:hypothetical protein [Verrucomicrobiota bacterium]
MNPVSASEHIQALYRLLLIRTGQRIQAEQALRRTLTESPHRAPGKTDLVEYYRAALKMAADEPESPRTDLAGWPLALHCLPEPQRSAITLFYLEVFSPRVLAEILGLDIAELARIIGMARKSLAIQHMKSTTPDSA